MHSFARNISQLHVHILLAFQAPSEMGTPHWLDLKPLARIRMLYI